MQIIPGGISTTCVVAACSSLPPLATAAPATRPGSARCPRPNGLRSPEVTLWTIWTAIHSLGRAALKRISGDDGEASPCTPFNPRAGGEQARPCCVISLARPAPGACRASVLRRARW